MSDENVSNDTAAQNRGEWSLRERGVIWLVCGTLLTVAVAWSAYQLQQRGFAPALIYPLLVGATLGAGQVGISRLTGFSARKLQLVAAICWGLLAVVGQDYIGYRAYFDERTETLNKALAAKLIDPHDTRFVPTSLTTFLSNRVGDQPVWWTLDLMLTALASAGIVWLNHPSQKRADSSATT